MFMKTIQQHVHCIYECDTCTRIHKHVYMTGKQTRIPIQKNLAQGVKYLEMDQVTQSPKKGTNWQLSWQGRKGFKIRIKI